MKRFPRLEHSAYAMIGLVGIKLAVTATQFTIPYFDLLFWSLLSSLFLFGFTEQKSHE
jgi:predicted tellurium resistance membrane protein TerC